MNFLLEVIAAALAAVFFAPAYAAEPAERQFASLAQRAPASLPDLSGQPVEVDVDLAASPGFSVALVGGRVEARYRMAFNDIAEGWSWRPQADPAVDDYYRYKYLPLQSVVVDRGTYAAEDKIGVVQQMKIRWRYDYFLAFDNLYAFYPRGGDDEAGFSADLPAAVLGHLGLRARGHLRPPVISESTTFWKATYGQPTDFTLKKRYLIAELDEIAFVDAASDRVLCRIPAGSRHCTAP